MTNQKHQLICEKAHIFYKSSTCKTCPICAQQDKPQNGFLSQISSPARRALLSQGIDTLESLSNFSEKKILQLHGIGKTSIPILKNILKASNLDFKKS